MDEINRKVGELSESKNSIEIYIDQLIIAMVELEEEKFEKMLATLTLKFGFEKTVVSILYPFLEKIGVLWLTDNITPAQEHFISHLIRQKIIVAIDALPLAPKTATKAILYLPENELHEIGLLFYHYIAKKEGIRTYYLGQTVPYLSLKSIFDEHKPQLLITSITSHPQPAALQGYIDRICTDFKSAKIFAAGYSFRKTTITKPQNLQVFETAEQLRELILPLK
jgi:hypothetical protein